MPTGQQVEEELTKAKSMEDFFGKEGIFARLFGKAMEEMLEAEMQEHLGYNKGSHKQKDTQNRRNGSYSRKLGTSFGDTDVKMPRDRKSEFDSKLLPKYKGTSNEMEEKIVGMYARGFSVRDIQDFLEETYGMEVSPTLISNITQKVMDLVSEWQERPLEKVYPIVYLDAIHMKIRLNGKVESRAVYHCLAVTVEGKKDILGQWVSDGAEGSNFWLKVISDLQSRGVEDILIACVDGLKGFKEAINSVFPDTVVQPCIIHKIRNSLKYVGWKHKKEFMTDLKSVYRAPTKDAAETALLELDEKWSDRYKLSVKKWQDDWDNLSQYFDYPEDIRRLIYTTNIIEGYHRQIRKVVKTKGTFPTAESAEKLLYLTTQRIVSKWNMPLREWSKILNQLIILFEGRLQL